MVHSKCQKEAKMEDVNKRPFDFEEKESYTLDEVKNILGQHADFIEGGFKDRIGGLEGELAPYREQDKINRIDSMMPENANKEMKDDIITLAKIGDEDSDDEIKSKLADVVSSRKYLQVDNSDKKADEIAVKGKETTKQEPAKAEEDPVLKNL